MRLLDFPIPLSGGVAWLRIPYPLSEADVERVRWISLWNLEAMKDVIVTREETGAQEERDG